MKQKEKRKEKKNLLLVLKRDGSKMYPFVFQQEDWQRSTHTTHYMTFDLSRLDTYGMEHLAMDWNEKLLPTWRKYWCRHDPTGRTKQPGLLIYHQHGGSESFGYSQNKQILGFLVICIWGKKWIISKMEIQSVLRKGALFANTKTLFSAPDFT